MAFFFAMSFLSLKGKTGYSLFPASCSVLSAAYRRPALWLSLTWHSASTEGNTQRRGLYPDIQVNNTTATLFANATHTLAQFPHQTRL